MTGLRFLTPAQLRASIPPEPEWLWDGYLAAGTIALLAGKPKAGKSTLAFAVAEAIAVGAPSFLGRDVGRAGVVYVSEESATTVLSKLPADNVDGFHVLTRDAAWPRPDWPTLAAAATMHAIDAGARLLVIDTAAYWTALPAEREKDAGAVTAAMQPLLDATRQGLAVLAVHHQRKGGGEDGEAIRGSSAWAGSVDTILELERPGDDAPGQRLLVAIGRFPQTPVAVLVDRDPATGTWRAIGQPTGRRDAQETSLRASILDALPDTEPGLNRAEIEERTGLDWRKLGPPLRALTTAGTVRRDGAGRRGDPHRYRKLSSRPEDSNGTERTATAADSLLYPYGEDSNESGRRTPEDTNGATLATPAEEARILRLVADHDGAA